MKMSLLLFNPLTSLSSLPPFSSPTPAFIATPVSRLHVKAFELKFKTWNGVRFQNPIRGNRIGAVVVRASSDIDGTAPTETREPPVEGKEEVVSVDKFPKLQEREEQKLKMKLARKIRLRRNRLVRKRRMRKKVVGRLLR
ncbi:50S RIBOSOMAL PROTEIN 5 CHLOROPLASTIC [Salix purpurea]|uniref:50S RIBOSOMAL PROTEIN 5 CHLOROPLASTIC n=1 Tax=Salix purpurea TaxID=77065 RepID=A0A9Q1A356_SALPP|nr:50S RIBOSOMAL PROTEIN 5 CHLOROPLASTIC [Salix purpurea]